MGYGSPFYNPSIQKMEASGIHSWRTQVRKQGPVSEYRMQKGWSCKLSGRVLNQFSDLI